MNNVLLQTKNLSKIYTDDRKSIVKAVNDITLQIYQGETFGLVGESGCGKSTFGQMLVNLLEPTKGEILFEGEDIFKSRRARKEIPQKIQMIFQDPYSSLNPKRKIGWLLEESLDIHRKNLSKEQRIKIVDEMFELVGLDESYKDRYPSQLSGGQRQRVSIAIALILNPKFVVCDEAVSALDVSVQAQILNLLHDLQEKFNLTYLFISHNLNVVSYMSDRIGVMYLGSIVELGDAVTLSKNPIHPYTKMLFSSSMNVGETDSGKVQITGELPSPSNPPSGCTFHTRCAYCTELCSSARPELQELPDGRQIACHYAQKFYQESMEKKQ